MKCTESAGLMDLYITDALSPWENYCMFRHLKTCENCREELEVRLLVHMIGTSDSDSFHLGERMTGLFRDRRRRVISMFILLCTALCLFVGALIFLFISIGGIA